MKKVVAIFIFFITAACQSQVSSEYNFDVQIVEQSRYCRVNQQEIVVIKTIEEKNQYFGNRLISKSSPTKNYNFKDYMIVLVAAGKKPTGGYHYELMSDKAKLKSKTLFLPLQLIQPNPDMLQTQIITSPCVTLAIKKNKKFLDQEVKLVMQK